MCYYMLLKCILFIKNKKYKKNIILFSLNLTSKNATNDR